MLTPQQSAAVHAIDLDHRDVRNRAMVLARQLKGTPQEGIDKPLKDAIALEGQHITALINLIGGVQPSVPDPDDARESVRQTQWGCGQ